MVSDFDVIGIPPTTDLSAIKDAYRRRVMEVHPDHSSEEDAFKNHLRFIQINQAYRRLKASIPSIARNGPKASPAPRPKPVFTPQAPLAEAPARTAAPGTSTLPALHRDPAYVLYKAATRYFEQIHPGKWNLDATRQLNRPFTPEDAQDQEEMRAIVKSLTGLFPKAYYYYSLVVNEHPESVWAPDSLEKMSLIEKRTKLYGKILESFGVWVKSGAYRSFKPLGG
jgi:hypothetical protein